MQRFDKHFATRTPQSRPTSNRQAFNNAGGYAYPVDNWIRLDRFLVLGTEGGTYYQDERGLTVENAQAVQAAIREDGPRVVARVVEISNSGRAPKNDPALFVLAMCASAENEATRQAALRALPKVARIGTHLFHFARYVESFRGWGRALRRAVGDWYTEQPVARLAFQALKYQQRDGWSHRDLLRLAHPFTKDDARKQLYDWICRGHLEFVPPPALSQLVAAQELRDYDGNACADADVRFATGLIRNYKLPRECVPTELLNRPEIWGALLEDLPLGAMIRNLNKLTAIGLMRSGTTTTKRVIAALRDAERLLQARVHPLAILVAQKIYAQGQGLKGKFKWDPCREVIEALDKAFYLSFGGVEPTGKRLLLALDVSSSMTWDGICGSPLTPREGAAALALVALRTERHAHVCAFSSSGMARPRHGTKISSTNGISQLNLNPKMRLDHVLRAIDGLSFGGTDCALPMLYALERELSVDAFVVLTDSETWAGHVHPMEALRAYRVATGIPAKLIVVGMTSAGFSIADPEDGGCLDVVGFDLAVPQLIADFIR